jgi:hypothetical protein
MSIRDAVNVRDPGLESVKDMPCWTYSIVSEPKQGSESRSRTTPELVQEPSEVVFQASHSPPEMLIL